MISSLVLAVYFAESINEHLAKDHSWLTKHQYFDSPGLFISVMMSMPFLFFSSLIVVSSVPQKVIMLH